MGVSVANVHNLIVMVYGKLHVRSNRELKDKVWQGVTLRSGVEFLMTDNEVKLDRLDEEDFDFVEFVRNRQRRRRRFALWILLVSGIVLLGMIAFWR